MSYIRIEIKMIKLIRIIVAVAFICFQQAFACPDYLPKSFKCEKIVRIAVKSDGSRANFSPRIIYFHRIDSPNSKLVSSEFENWKNLTGSAISFQVVHAHWPNNLNKINVSSSDGREFYTSLNFQIDLNSSKNLEKILNYSSSEKGRNKPNIEDIAKILGEPLDKIVMYEDSPDTHNMCQVPNPTLIISMQQNFFRYCVGREITNELNIESVPAFYVSGKYLISPVDNSFRGNDLRDVMAIVVDLYNSSNAGSAPGGYINSRINEAQRLIDLGSYDAAKEYILPLAEANVYEAQALLGVIYISGKITGEKSIDDGMEWIKKSFHQEDPVVKNLVAIQFYKAADSAHDRRDYVEAFWFYRLGAELGHAKSQFVLGALYLNGEGVKKDLVEGEKWLKLASDQGNDRIQFLVGTIYENGASGMTKDYSEAARLYMLAGNQGHDIAQVKLGRMYEKGLGVTKDYVEAIKWYKLSAAQMNVNAQFFLGRMYGLGYGVTQNYITAYMWFVIAADAGDDDAIEMRNTFVEYLTPQEISEAKKLAGACLKNNFAGCL